VLGRHRYRLDSWDEAATFFTSEQASLNGFFDPSLPSTSLISHRHGPSQFREIAGKEDYT